MLPTTGPGAALATQMRAAYELALSHLGGKLGGRDTQLIYVDTQAKPEVARELADELIKSQKVQFITGVLFSNLVVALHAPITQAEVFFVEPIGGPAPLAGARCSNFFFNLSAQNDQVAEAMGMHLAAKKINKLYAITANYQAGKDMVSGMKRFYTGGLAGESRVFSEILKAHRAIEVEDLDEFTEVLAVCQGTRWPAGNGINVVTTSGGQAELILDVATSAGIPLRPLPAAMREAVERDVGRVTGDGNPLDAWGRGDFRTTTPEALRLLSENATTDAIVFCSSDSVDNQALGRAGREEDYAKLFAAAAAKSSKPHYFMSMRPGVLHSGQIRILAEAGVAVIGGTRQGLGAIERLARWNTPLAPVRMSKAAPSPELATDRRTINEFDAKTILAGHGLPVTRETFINSLEQAIAAASAISYPVVLKVVADDIPHKSEHGFVAVGLRDEQALTSAFDDMQRRVAALGTPIAGYLVQEMIGDGAEVFAGVSRDPHFGLTIAFGMGGVGVEVLRDFALRPIPLREGDAEAMIEETRGAALLGAFRGRAAADKAALVRCLYALSDFAAANSERIAEIDLNPIKARAKGCVIVDALIVPRKP